MNIAGQRRRSLEVDPVQRRVWILDQTLLPHEVVWRELRSLKEVAEAITVMRVRGAPLIGATAAWGMFFGLCEDASLEGMTRAYDMLFATRPTAVNLRWALDRVRGVVSTLTEEERVEAAWHEAVALGEEDVKTNRAIGLQGLRVLQAAWEKKAGTHGNSPLQVMTHCNAGWLAGVDWGTALAPVYCAQEAGLPVHVWVSETRPRGQGAALTAFELREQGVPHTLICDNNAGHLLQRGLVDVVLVGADRVTACGDVANKIGTYLKALAARAHDVPFYVAAPVSTIDWTLRDGIREIPIEQRNASEVTQVSGWNACNRREEVGIAPLGTLARNDAFDVTPAGLVTALITECGVHAATEGALAELRAVSRAAAEAKRDQAC